MTCFLSRALVVSALSLGAAMAVSAAAAEPAASTNVYFAGTVRHVAPFVLKTYGPPCPVQPAVLHAMAGYATGRWWIARQFPDCVHAQPGFRVTAELDSGRTIVVDQSALPGHSELAVGQRVWFESGPHRVRAMDAQDTP